MKKIDLIEAFRRKIKKKETLIGGWIQICDPMIVEIVCSYKFDWVCLDLEHGLFSTHNISNLVRSAELKKKIKLARLPNHNLDFCSQVMDAGCDGVIIPNIKDHIQLKMLKDAIYYPPKGKRGVGYSRENLFGKDFLKKNKRPKNPLIIAMIESKEGIKNLKDILEVEGLDAILIGPYDLSASLGVTGNFKSLKFRKAIKYIKEIAKKKKISIGIHVLEDNYKILKKYQKEGYNFLPYCTDAMLLEKSIEKLFK